MNKTKLVIALAGFIGALALPVAHADSVEATCEVRKDGETKQGQSGPCTFGQRQGFIDIDLKNGDTLSLSPGNGADQFRDQRGNKVHRTSAGSNSQEFKWEGGKRLTVTFLGGHHSNSNNNGYGDGAAGYGSTKERDDYQRGYRDGLEGRYDQYDHTQSYKDGVRAGEEAASQGSGSGKNNHGNQGSYRVEDIGNGNYEILWKNGCIADYDARGRSTGYTQCNDEMKRRSDEVARDQRR